MLQSKELFFAAANCEAFERAFEGWYRSLGDEWIKANRNEFSDDDITVYQSTTGYRNFLSCWFRSEMESHAMWRQYGGGMDSLAIQCDPSIFKRSEPVFIDSRHYSIKAGPVEYLHLTTRGVFHSYDQPNDDDLFWYKDKIYDFENEWRMIITLDDVQVKDLPEESRSGLAIKTDLNLLIERVYFSPSMDPHHQKLWEEILRDYGLECEVRPSRFVSL